jgi:hypothetical protein
MTDPIFVQSSHDTRSSLSPFGGGGGGGSSFGEGPSSAAQAQTSQAQTLMPLVPIALSAFFLSGLVYYHVQFGGRGAASGWLEGPVVGLYHLLGFVAASMLCLLVLAWSSIWFATGRLESPGTRITRLLALSVALAVLVNLDSAATRSQVYDGQLGALLTPGLVSVLGPSLATLLVSLASLGALLLATDFFFYKYFAAIHEQQRVPAAMPGAPLRTEAERAELAALHAALAPASPPVPVVVDDEPLARMTEREPAPDAERAAADEHDREDPVANVETPRRWRRVRLDDLAEEATEVAAEVAPEIAPQPPALVEPANVEADPAGVEGAALGEKSDEESDADADDEEESDEELEVESDSEVVILESVGEAPAIADEPSVVASNVVVDAVAEPSAERTDTPAEAPTEEVTEEVTVELEIGEPEIRETPATDPAAELAAVDEPTIEIPRPDARQGLLFGGALSQELVDEAASLVRDTHRANATFLQRRLRVDYETAIRLLDALRMAKVVDGALGEANGRVVVDP